MRRREFAKLVAATVAWPMVASAQQRMPVIGFLSSGSPGAGTAANVAGFQQGLSENGFAVGKNIEIEYHWAETRYDRLPRAMPRPAIIPAGSWPRRMPVELAAGYCGESTVEAFLKRVGSEYPQPRITEGRRRLWLRDDLDQAILPPDLQRVLDVAEDL